MNKRTRFLIFVLLTLMGLLPAYAQQGTGATRGAYWQQRGVNQNATRSILPPQTFTVNSTADAVDADLSDNLCAAADNTCTLRAAIQSANAAPGSAKILAEAVCDVEESWVNETGRVDGKDRGERDSAQFARVKNRASVDFVANEV